MIGVFTALDLFLFFFFWEVMLIPMYFIIAIWGHENKNYAAMKFFIFTQVTGMLMLVSILVLAYSHYTQFGSYSFKYEDLLSVSLAVLSACHVAPSFTTKLPSVLFILGCRMLIAKRPLLVALFWQAYFLRLEPMD